jgi:hypothetical protein
MHGYHNVEDHSQPRRRDEQRSEKINLPYYMGHHIFLYREYISNRIDRYNPVPKESIRSFA